MAYTDPTGNVAFRQILGFAIAVVGTLVVPQLGTFWARLGAAVAFGFASGYVASGTLRGGVTGAFTAAVTLGIATGFTENIGIFAQAFSGGVLEAMQGGRFGNGFVAAGLTTAVMPNLGYIRNDVARSAVGALVGGTISKATGGKFANGAISGAVQGAMAKAPKNRYAVEIEGNSVGDGTDGAPAAYVDRIRDHGQRQAFLNDLADSSGLAYIGGKIRYVDGYDPINPNTGAYTDGLEVVVFQRTFEFNYHAILSVLQHESSHFWLIRTGAYSGVRGENQRKGALADPEYYSLELNVIDQQMNNPTFKLTSPVFRDGIQGYRAAQVKLFQYQCSTGMSDCRGLYGF